MKIGWAGVVLGAAACAVVAAACGKAGPAKPPGQAASAPRPVQVAAAAFRPVERVIPVTGTLAAQEQSTLSSKITGRLQRLAVDIGSVVRQGDVLAQIEPRDYELRLQQSRAALAQARSELGLPLEGEDDRVELAAVTTVKKSQAVLEEARKNRDRVHSLSKSGIASQSELDAVDAAYTVASSSHETSLDDARTRTATLAQRRAEYDIARKQLADATVTAPFDGAVLARPAGVGEYMAAGTPIVVLVKIDPLRLRLQVPERESVLVQLGQPVRLRVEGDTNSYGGRIARLAPALNEADRMLQAEADVPGRGSLRAGLFARAEIIINEHDQALAIPARALTSFAGIEKAVTIKEGKALERVVTTGRRGEDWVEILTGLSVGENVVLDPAGLRSGQPVTLGDTPPAGTTNDASRGAARVRQAGGTN